MGRAVRFRAWAAAVLVLAGGGGLSASPTGSIIGFAKDPSGAFVPGVKITLTSIATNVRFTTVTGSSGAYQFPQLPPAAYSLIAEASGFKTTSIADVLVQVDQITHVDVGLEIGGQTDVVEVFGAVPLLETDKSALSHVVENRAIAGMPLNARQFLDLALLTPGASPAAAGTPGGFTVAGARSQSNLYLIDGVSNLDTGINTPLDNFRITDAVQEFAVQTSVPLPEFGRGAGAQVNIVTKTGGNRFHGSTFEYFRNTRLDAADFFTNKLRGRKGALNRNQFGGTLGGPIARDRTFFFVSCEGFRQAVAVVSPTRVPSAAERATVIDPISRRLLQFWPDANAAGTLNYVGNVPSRTSDNTGLVRIDHALGKRDHLSGRWIEFQGSAVTAGPTPLSGGDSNHPITRSFVLNQNHTFSPAFLNEIRLGFSRLETALIPQDQGLNAAAIFTGSGGSPVPGVVDGIKDPVHSGLPRIVIAGGFAPLGSADARPLSRTINTYELFENMSLLNPFGRSRHSWRWGFHVRREEFRGRNDQSTRGLFNLASFADFAAGLVDNAILRSGATLNYTRHYPCDLYWQDQYKLKDNFTLNYGIRYEYPSAPAELQNHWTNFLPGIGPMVAGSDRVLDIDPEQKGAAAIVFRHAPFTLSSSAGARPDKNNFAPVVGFAYLPRFAKAVFGSNATVIRGGFRVGYDENQSLMFTSMARNAPYNLTTRQIANVTQPGRFPWGIGFDQHVPLISNFGRQGPGTPQVGVLTFFALDLNLPSAYMSQFNLGIQRKLGREFSAEADYQGSEGHKLAVASNMNQPAVIVRNPAQRGPVAPNEQVFPYNRFGAVALIQPIGNSNYHGMVLTGKYQGRRGIFFQGSYTVGKSIDDHSAYVNEGLSESRLSADNNNRRLERGPSTFDVRHRAVFLYLVELPAGPGHRFFGWNNGFTRQVFGGWQISGITTLQTGAPFTVIIGGPDSSGFNSGAVPIAGNADRPDIIRSGPLPQDNRNPDAAFDRTYFRPALAGRVGTSGRNQYYGPGVQNYDFAVAKSFPLVTKLAEATRIQFRADFFNLFNHTNFANPVRDMSDSNFGKITQTVGTAVQTGAVATTAGPLGGPRLIQLSLRLQF